MSAGPIMIMSGGTGGHVFPGLAVAQAVRARRGDVVWLGTRRGLEASLVPQADIDIEWISVSGLRGRGLGAWLFAPFRLSLAVAQAIATLRRRRPAAVLGMGGFVSGPGGVAAWLSGRPLLIHEQNAVAGTANRWLSRLARQVFEGFPGSFPERVRAELIGNPVRASIAALPPPRERFAARPPGARRRVLVLGGSQGARALNRAVPSALAAMPAELRPEIWHQAGAGIDEARAAYRSSALSPRLEPFIADVDKAYEWADLVVARAGALTLSELAAAGLGAVLIPYPHATDDHQTQNAVHFTRDGAGIIVPEPELDPARLARLLAELLTEPGRLLAMAEHARRQARTGAAERLASACLAFAEADS